MPIATFLLFVLTSGFLLATCLTDPGVIPRREVIIATGSQARLERALGYDLLALGDGKSQTLDPELSQQGYRWCRTCRVIRPPRASHCPDCDNCVLRYDHHCPFVNNCVGQRNYVFFFGFVTSILCLAITVLPVLFWFVNSDNFEKALGVLATLGQGPLRFLFVGMAGIFSVIGLAGLATFVLWLYHLFLIFTSRTTKEFRRDIPNVAEEPTLCARRGPRLFDPRAFVDPRDLIRHDERLSWADTRNKGCCDWSEDW